MKFILLFCLFFATSLDAQVPNLLSHQGRVAVRGVNFEGLGLFKFALVNGNGSVTYWSNDGTSTAGGEPANATRLPVTRGLYSVLLGDTSLSNMTAVPASVLTNPDVRLRVWFDNLTHGFELLTPDQRLAPNGYIPDGAVTSAKLAPGVTFPPVYVTGSNQAAAANSNYVVTSATAVNFTLPPAANIGDTIQITAVGSGGWYIPGEVQNFWEARESNRDWIALASSAAGNRLVAAVSPGQLYTSSDAGANWTARDSVRNWNSVASSSDGLRMAALGDGGGVFVSVDAGVTWTLRLSYPSSSIAMSGDGQKILVGGTPFFTFTGGVFFSSDGGLNWATVQTSGSYKVALSADGTTLAVGREGYSVSVSTDAGANWTPNNPSVSATWKSITCSADGMTIAGIGENSPIFISKDRGQTWAWRDTLRQWRSITVSAEGAKLAAVASGGQIYISLDGGNSWVPEESNRNWSAITGSADGSRLVAAVMGGQIYTSSGLATSGVQGSETTFAYAGNGEWVRVAPEVRSEAIADGAVTAAKLAAGIGMWTASGAHVYRGSGNVGIHTATPNYGLSLGNGIANTKLALYDNGPGFSYGLGIQAAQFRFHVDAPSARFSFLDGPAGTEIVTIQGNGNVGIGRIPVANRLEVAGDASKSTAGAWLANSDRRIKTDIQPVTGALETLEKVRPVTFRYTEEYRRAHPDIRNLTYYNVVAQEFREVYPDAVKESGENLPDGSKILQVDTYPATITAIAAIKELKAENEELKRRLAALEETVRRISQANPETEVIR